MIASFQNRFGRVLVALYAVFAMSSAFGQAQTFKPPVTAPVSFNFTAFPLSAFAQATYKNLLGRDFVISPDLVGLDKRITISVASLDRQALPAFVDDLLLSQGVAVEKRGGIYYLVPAKAVVPGEKPAVAAGEKSDLVAPAAGQPAVAGSPGKTAVEQDEKPDPVKPFIYVPKNRPAEFLVGVVNAAYRKPYAVQAGFGKLVVSVPEEEAEGVRDLLDALDSPSKNVEVSASFVEVSRSSNSSRGLSLVANVLGQKFSAAVGSGAGSLSVKGGSFEAVLDALDADGRFKQISNARVRGDESKHMNFISGDETPTIGSTGRDQIGNSIQNIVYRSSGVILDVMPEVLSSGRLSLVVDGQISNFQNTVTGVTGSPTLIKRQVKTSIHLADGEVVVLGGLDDTKTTDNRSGLAFLPRSWAGKTSVDSHTDLVLILSAKVLQ